MCVQLVLLLASLFVSSSLSSPSLHVVSNPKNDIVNLLLQNKFQPTPKFWSSIDDAVRNALNGDALLVTNELYPNAGVNVTVQQYLRMVALGLRVYIEMPVILPQAVHARVTPTAANQYLRFVVSGNTTLTLPYLSVLQPQGVYYMPYSTGLQNCDLVLGLVAGYRTAPYGLPSNPISSVCRAMGAPNVVVSSTKLSNLVTTRFSPIASWNTLWNNLLTYLIPNATAIPPWSGPVQPMLTKSQSTAGSTPSSELNAFRRATTWLAETSGLMVKGQSLCPAQYAPIGVQPMCMLEGFLSQILPDGSQQSKEEVRMDCVAEMSMPFAMRAVFENDMKWVERAGDLLDYTWRWSWAAQGDRNDVTKNEFGLVAWAIVPVEELSYGDDNARVILGSMMGSVMLRTFHDNRCDFWDEMILKSILGNYRVANPNTGFRPTNIQYSDINSKGWQWYRNANFTYSSTDGPQPHFQAEMWSAFLLAYVKTGHKGFLTMVTGGVEQTMALYPAKWVWTEYISEEQCRLVLTLAWLYRITKNTTHLQWMNTLAGDYLSNQQPSGAVQEKLGTPGLCWDCPPPSNDKYGTQECGLMQDDTDPVTDQLYSNNYAIFSLWEAYKATGDYTRYGSAVDKLASYLTAIQTNSTLFPYLSGGWVRAFDYELWEYFGMSSDWGWGAFSFETGWTASWISATLGLRQKNVSFFDTAVGAWNTSTFSVLCPQVLSAAECSKV